MKFLTWAFILQVLQFNKRFTFSCKPASQARCNGVRWRLSLIFAFAPLPKRRETNEELGNVLAIWSAVWPWKSSKVSLFTFLLPGKWSSTSSVPLRSADSTDVTCFNAALDNAFRNTWLEVIFFYTSLTIRSLPKTEYPVDPKGSSTHCFEISLQKFSIKSVALLINIFLNRNENFVYRHFWKQNFLFFWSLTKIAT